MATLNFKTKEPPEGELSGNSVGGMTLSEHISSENPHPMWTGNSASGGGTSSGDIGDHLVNRIQNEDGTVVNSPHKDTNGNQLFAGFKHNHDSVYADLYHNHDNLYAALIHQHLEYATISQLAYIRNSINSNSELKSAPLSGTGTSKFVDCNSLIESGNYIVNQQTYKEGASTLTASVQNAPSTSYPIILQSLSGMSSDVNPVGYVFQLATDDSGTIYSRLGIANASNANQVSTTSVALSHSVMISHSSGSGAPGSAQGRELAGRYEYDSSSRSYVRKTYYHNGSYSDIEPESSDDIKFRFTVHDNLLTFYDNDNTEVFSTDTNDLLNMFSTVAANISDSEKMSTFEGLLSNPLRINLNGAYLLTISRDNIELDTSYVIIGATFESWKSLVPSIPQVDLDLTRVPTKTTSPSTGSSSYTYTVTHTGYVLISADVPTGCITFKLQRAGATSGLRLPVAAAMSGKDRNYDYTTFRVQKNDIITIEAWKDGAWESSNSRNINSNDDINIYEYKD